MKKEEFLAISLPYGLKVYDCIGESIELVDYSKGCPKCVCEAIGKTKNENKCVNVFQAAFDKQLKPILHSMSDLTKPIEHNGEKFVPLHRLLEMSNFNLSKMSINQINDYECVYNDIDVISFKDAMYLISIHFDLYGLIDKGEAIDVNTLENNPYK